MARNILISRRDWMQDGEASFVSGVGNWVLPLTNLLDPRPQVVAEAADTMDWASTQFQVDLGYVRKVGLIWFANLRATSMGVIEIKAGEDPTFSYNEYSTITSTWPPDGTAAFELNPWGELSLTHVYMPDEYDRLQYPRFFIPDDVINCRYISVEIRDSTNSQPLQIGNFGACEVWEAAINFEYGWQMTILDDSEVTRIPHGSTYIYERAVRRRLNLGFTQHSDEEAWQRAFGVPLIKARSTPLVIIPQPEDTYNVEKQSIYGLLSADSQLSNPFIGRFAQTFQIEDLR